jgi:hypothetical protein
MASMDAKTDIIVASEAGKAIPHDLNNRTEDLSTAISKARPKAALAPPPNIAWGGCEDCGKTVVSAILTESTMAERLRELEICGQEKVPPGLAVPGRNGVSCATVVRATEPMLRSDETETKAANKTNCTKVNANMPESQ